MATIGSLVVSIRATVDDFIGDMKAVQKELDATTKFVKPLTTELTNIGTVMAGVGTIVVGGLSAIARQTSETGVQMAQLSQRTGMATADLAALQVAAEHSQLSVDDLNNGMKKFSVSVVDAANGSQKQLQAFQSMGISVTDTNGKIKPMGELLREVTAASAGMADGIDKANDASVLFGKGGQSLIPMLNQLGRDGFDAARQKAEAFGLVMSDNALKNADAFNEAADSLESSLKGLALTIGEQLMPVITPLIDGITNTIMAIRQWIAVHPEVTQGVLGLAAAIGGAGGLVLAVAGVLAIWPSLVAAFTVLSGPIGIAVAGITALTAAFIAFPQFRGVVVEVLKDIVDAVALVGSYFASVGQAVMDLATGKFKDAYNTMANSWNNAMDTMQKADDGFNSTIKVASESVQGFGNVVKETTPPLTEFQKHMLEVHAEAEALAKSFEQAQTKNEALAEGIQLALKAHVDLQTIIDKTGKSVVDYVAQLTRQGEAIPPVLQEIAEATLAQDKWTTEIGMTTQEILKLGLTMPQIEQMGQAFKAAYETAQKASTEAMNQMQKDADLATSYWSKVYLQVLDAQIKAENVSQKAYEDVVKDAEAHIKFLSELEKQQLDQEAKDADERVKEIQKQNEANAEYIKKTNQEVANSAGKIFDDMFVKGQSVFSSLQNALKGGALSIGRTIFDDIVGYLGGPIKRAFDDFFTGLLESSGLKGFLNGLGQKLGGLLSSVLGGGGSGLAITGIDIGAAIGEGGAGAAAGGAAAAGSAGGAGVLGSLGAFMTNPWTIGIAGAIAAGAALFEALRSTTHLAANQFVQQFQNPFGDSLKQIADANAAALTAGQQTVEGAKTALSAVQSLWQQFQDSAAQFASKSADNQTVVNQAMAQLGPLVNSITASIQQNITDLQNSQAQQQAATAATTKAAASAATAAQTAATVSLQIARDTSVKVQQISEAGGVILTSSLTAAQQKIDSITRNGVAAITAAANSATTSIAAASGSSAAGASSSTLHNGTAFTTPNGTVYLNAQQISDLQNSVGSYSLTSGYQYLVPNALQGVDVGGNATLYSPGFVSSLTDDQKKALGIGSFASGGYVNRDQLALVHAGERVINKDGQGGGDTYNIYIDNLSDTRYVDMLMDKLNERTARGKRRLYATQLLRQ